MSKQPKKFEYALEKMGSFNGISAIEEHLNVWGDEGWELCGFEYGSFIFKRELHDEE